MQDKNGNLVSSPPLIEKLSLETFKERLRNRNIKDNLINMKNDKEEICKAVLKNASKNKTRPWNMEQLEEVLKYLKNNKSRDPFGYANELFKDNSAGADLKYSN